MQVRDRTRKVSEHKGRNTDACEAVCPCRPCYRPHDCGYFLRGDWKVNMECVTRYHQGCPQPLPEPEHLPAQRGGRCQRCGTPIVSP